MTLPTGFANLGPASKSQLGDLLEQVQILSDFSRREIETLALYVGAYRIEPGTTIFAEGGKDNFLCFLVEGTVEVLKRQKDDEHRRLASIRPGKAIGEMAFLDKQPHSATVTSPGVSVALVLSEDAFERLSNDNPRLALKLLWRLSQLLSHRLRQTSGQLVDYL